MSRPSRARGLLGFLHARGGVSLRPDEIWVRIEYHHGKQVAVVRRRYIAEFEVPGETGPALAVFELGVDGWSGITVFNPEDYQVNDLRFGVRLYRRGL